LRAVLPSVVVRVVVLAAGVLAPASAHALDPLPEGDAGIAAAYPGDAGIEADPQVVFADDFESYVDASGLAERWDAAVYQVDRIAITTDAAHVHGGAQAIEMNVPQQEAELSNAIDRAVSPELDVLFLRFYSKFEGPYDIVGSSHNGGMIASHYFIDGQATPGVPANGTNKWLVDVENWRGEAETASPGLLNVYIYHPEQRSDYGDHFWPDGTITPYDPDPPPDYFGPDFVARPLVIPSLDEWHCYEMMVQANTPGERDGRIAFWFDGVLAADFPNLRLRDVPELTIDRFGLSFHIGSNPDAPQRKWYDDVVAAHAYIGPVYEGGAADDTGSGDNDTSGGDDGPMTSTTSASGSGSEGSATASTVGDESTGESDATEGGGDAQDGDGSGCGCGVRAPSSGVPFGLAVLLAWQRRRSRR
jgi:hypothetical protein